MGKLLVQVTNAVIMSEWPVYNLTHYKLKTEFMRKSISNGAALVHMLAGDKYLIVSTQNDHTVPMVDTPE